METWVALSIAAAFLQNLRSALQKTLAAQVGVIGATYARFVFAAPWALLLVATLFGPLQVPAPVPTVAFAVWAGAGGLAQIAGTLLLLHLFSLRNFAVGNAFAKTETVQAALLGLLVLGDRLGFWPFVGICVSLGGVVLLSATRGLAGGLWNRGAALGLACGAAFALSAVAYRAAGLALAGPEGFAPRAALTLACVTLLQTAVMTAWLRGRALPVLAAWRVAAPVGLAGMLASFAWFAAFGLASAAEVKAVGQVELVFSWLTARLAFGERPSLRETLGIVLVSLGIAVLVLTR